MVAVATLAADPLQVPPTGTVASNFTTTLLGRAGVSVLEIRSFTTESDTKPLGVTGHEQHETSCSSGENVNTFAQNAPVTVAELPERMSAPKAPTFVMLMTESAKLRFGK